MSDSRLEKFIYAICSMDVSDLPVPLSRIEKLWNCLITGETPDFEPLSRNEKYLMAMLDRYDISNLPDPMSRGEKLLYKIAVGETDLSDVPGYLSRYEELLKYLIENGGISGGDFEYVLYTLNQSLYTLYTTAEKPVKSAKIYGQTLVNRVMDQRFGGNSLIYESHFETNQFNGGETFTVFVVNPNISQALIGIFNMSETWIRNQEIDVRTNKKFTFTVEDSRICKFVAVTVTTSSDSTGFEDSFVVLKGDQTHLNINTYFEGMQSVKMPVLTTTNGSANILTDSQLNDKTGEIEPHNNSNKAIEDYILIPNNPVIVSNVTWLKISFYDANKVYISNTGGTNINKFELNDTTIPANAKYFRFHYNSASLPLIRFVNGTDYIKATIGGEPFKTNILTVNEEVELRGIGNVQDTLDLMTGEMTERIGEIVLDGTQSNVGYRSEYSNDDYYCFMYDITKNGYKKAPSSPIGISCPIPFQQNRMFPWETPKEFVLIDGNELVVKLLKSRLSNDNSISTLITYLASNPITINYPLMVESIKTVDLTTVDQDNQPTQLGTFENVTHVSLESAGLIPEVEMEVATHISKELASASPLMDELSTNQQQLESTVDEQSNNVDATMIATTEIYEETL